MLDELPKACNVGTKRNSKGHTTSWIGYKLHIDTADGGIPVSCLLTSVVTARRRLKVLSAYTSYNRNGRYYTLPEIAHFDDIGLWRHQGAFFSKHGNLKQNPGPSGHSLRARVE